MSSYSQRGSRGASGAGGAPLTPKVTSKSTQKSEQPAHSKPFKFENEKGRIGPREDEWRPGKRMNITAQDTGRLQNKTIVSVESPDWMKSFFENNRSYFEKQGVAQKLKKADIGDSAAGVPSSARQRGKKPGAYMTCDETGIPYSQTVGSPTSPDWMQNPWKPATTQTPRRVGERAGKDRHTNPPPRPKSANEMQHLLVSDKVPQWMRSSAVVEVMSKGERTPRRVEQDDSRAAGVTTERIWDESTRNKGGHMVHPLTGKVLHKAQQSEDFPLESGRSHRAAFEDSVRQRPHSARLASGRGYAGDRSKELRDMKKGAVVDQTTGKVANNSIVSPESPQWMKEPFENNRQYFQNQGVAQKLRTLSAEELRETHFVAGRKVPVRPRQVHKQITTEAGKVQNMSIVSRTAPDWMKSPFESNRTYFETAGIAQSKDLPRSRSAPPTSAPSVAPAASVAPTASAMDSPRSPEPLEAPALQLETPSYAALAKDTAELKNPKGVPCHAEQRSERRRKSGSVVSDASRRSSSASATYSARYRSRGSMTGQC